MRLHAGRLTYDEYGHASFDLCFHGDVLGHIALEVPGEFQVYNALAALACAHSQGADMAMACHAMNEFKGAHRRFELTGEVEGVRLYHDYGHNPTEMRNVPLRGPPPAARPPVGGDAAAHLQPRQAPL